ncbi:pyridoxal phosphate-dependent aminotransferase [Armatimonas rosea]|uniref:Aminotransferase n=1 Tax=Armatimonas rosea TaxID=685828 RepID=A0A7W9SSI4_ARMRO|nr:pyridoxal phosphate-dependent aminotransferase [Armatimonas rosea]MBB6052042.1 aspartate aminotransferase [Armatimonas rosea]
MSRLSPRALNCAPSPTLAITAKANQLKADGHDVLGFGAGEPDFDTPQHIKDAAIDALAKGKTKYTPSAGIPELRKAICEKLKTDNGLDYAPGNVIVSCGGKHTLYNIFQAMVSEGDEVVIPAPYWVSYPEQVKLADGTPVILQTTDETNFAPTIDQLKAAITPKTKIVVLNSPSNPTGAMWPRATIEALAELAIQHDFYVISDEIYEKIVYDANEFISIAALGPEIKKRTFTVNGMSKAYSMTGWRLGYVAAEAEYVGAMNRLQDQSTSNPTSIAQWAGLAALTGDQSFLAEWCTEFDARRKLIVAGLNGIDGLSCLMPEGAFYVFPKVSALYGKTTPEGKTLQSGDDVADYLLATQKVAVVPGSGFGADDYVRLSYATSRATIEKGVARIAEAVAALK